MSNQIDSKKRNYSQFQPADFMRKFKSAHDMYNYFTEKVIQVKICLTYLFLQMQYSLPPYNQLNKDWWKQVLKDEKKVFKVTEIKPIIVPKIEELSVPKVLQMVKSDKEICQYLPDGYFKKTVPDRTWFFNTINTLLPDFLPHLIAGAS